MRGDKEQCMTMIMISMMERKEGKGRGREFEPREGLIINNY